MFQMRLPSSLGPLYAEYDVSHLIHCGIHYLSNQVRRQGNFYSILATTFCSCARRSRSVHVLLAGEFAEWNKHRQFRFPLSEQSAGRLPRDHRATCSEALIIKACLWFRLGYLLIEARTACACQSCEESDVIFDCRIDPAAWPVSLLIESRDCVQLLRGDLLLFPQSSDDLINAILNILIQIGKLLVAAKGAVFFLLCNASGLICFLRS